MTRVETTLPTEGKDLASGGPGTPPAGIPIVVTVVEAPACHLCDNAKAALAVLAQSYPLTVQVLKIGDEDGRALMNKHRAPMSPLVLLDGAYFSSGRLPRRKLERRLAKTYDGDKNA